MRGVALLICLCTSVAVAQPRDWQVERDPFDAGIVARYKARLARDPFDRTLASLIALYRKHRTVAQLERELAAKPETWATAVVLARVAEARRDRDRALAMYTRAAELNDADARTWLAIGDTSATTAAARTAYERALAVTSGKAMQRRVLRKLLALGGDVDAQETVYARLLALDPEDGRLWLERGDLLATHGLAERAIDAYTSAVDHLRRDPERRIYALAQRGLARRGAGDTAGALADYEDAIAMAPRGYYFVAELVERTLEIHEERGTVPELLRQYERAWPDKKRGHFEWLTLARLHEATGDHESAIAALERAIAKAPTELATHRKLVALLDHVGRPRDALARLEAAARIAPRDPAIHLELAERYITQRPDKLLAKLAALRRTHANNPDVRHDIAELYTRIGKLELAIREYEAVSRIEPDDANIKALGEAYWAAGKVDDALATWRRLARAGTPAAYAALAKLLAEHELVQEALAAYSRAIDLDEGNPELWRARGGVYEADARWSSALTDTERAVALLGTAPRDVGHTARYQLVRILVAMRSEGYYDEVDTRITQWELAFGFDNDLAAGYLLAEYYSRHPDARLATILERLRELVPTDHGVAVELVRAYRRLGEYENALELALHLKRVAPERAGELDVLIAQLRVERARPPPPSLLERHGAVRDPEPEIRATRELRHARHEPPPRTSPARLGVRVGVGAGLRGPTGRALTGGAIGTFGSGPISLVTRLDWVQRADEMRSVSALAGSLGVAGHVLDTRGLVVTLGAAQRFERRFGDLLVDYERTGFAADVTLDLVPRDWPTSFGARFEQGLSEGARSSQLLFELSVELR